MPQETTNLSLVEYFFDGIDFVDKLILDAGTGPGQTTERLVNRVIEVGKSSRIISVDHNQKALDNVRNELGDKAEVVQFVKADLADMPQVQSSSLDIIACTDVLCMVEMRPLRSMKVLSEFKRMLKPEGKLIIGEQVPTPKATVPKEQVWARRWQLVKAMNHLLEQRHLEEITPEDLEFCLATLGFDSIRWSIFEGEDFGNSVEWGLRRPLDTAKRLSDELLQEALVKQIDELRNIFAQHGGAFLPYYVMHARKKLCR
ncbi:class I SAM-dependent methyltransferase [Candidatus Poribacteria bacterium]|nr:class I SAM-dependent methyltransferase [Candidatus Poribacteria bacterium]